MESKCSNIFLYSSKHTLTGVFLLTQSLLPPLDFSDRSRERKKRRRKSLSSIGQPEGMFHGHEIQNGMDTRTNLIATLPPHAPVPLISLSLISPSLFHFHRFHLILFDSLTFTSVESSSILSLPVFFFLFLSPRIFVISN